MKYIRIVVLLVATTVALATATSCSKEEKLVGTWTAKKYGVTTDITFNKGGTGIIVSYHDGYDGYDGYDSITQKMTWALDKSQLTIRSSTKRRVDVLEGTFDGKRLTVEGTPYRKLVGEADANSRGKKERNLFSRFPKDTPRSSC